MVLLRCLKSSVTKLILQPRYNTLHSGVPIAFIFEKISASAIRGQFTTEINRNVDIALVMVITGSSAAKKTETQKLFTCILNSMVVNNNNSTSNALFRILAMVLVWFWNARSGSLHYTFYILYRHCPILTSTIYVPIFLISYPIFLNILLNVLRFMVLA